MTPVKLAIDVFLAWLNTHWTCARRCPVCNGVDWQANNALSADDDDLTVHLTAGTRTIPVVPVVCRACGFVRLFSAMIIKKGT